MKMPKGKPTYQELENKVRALELSLKAAKKAAGEKEDFLNALINAIPIPVFYKDRAGKYIGVNESFEAFFGMKKDRLIGKSVFDINPRKLAETFHSKDNELFHDGGIQQYDSQVKNASGQIRDVVFFKSVYPKKSDNAQGLIGAVLDETDRKKTALALKESERKFRAIFDNAMDGILVGDTGTKKFVMANCKICEMLGYSHDELLKLSVNDIHPKKELPLIMDAFERQANGEFRVAENLPVKRKDKTVFYADISSSPMTIGKENFLVGIFRDITERRKDHQEREALISRLEKALEKIKHLSGIVPICSHCKSIRDDKGYWNRVETYLALNPDAGLSHGICPNCARKYYPDMGIYDDE